MMLREILSAHFPTLSEASTVRDAIDKMDLYQFSALVLVDEDAAPIGVVTEGDLSRAAAEKGLTHGIAAEPAHVYASKDPIVFSPEQEISDVLHRLLSSGLTLAPVVEAGKLIGVATRARLMQAMLFDEGATN